MQPIILESLSLLQCNVALLHGCLGDVDVAFVLPRDSSGSGQEDVWLIQLQ